MFRSSSGNSTKGTRSIPRSDLFWVPTERDMVCGTRSQAYQAGPLRVRTGSRVLAFEDLMPSQRGLTIAKRAVSWADSTVEIERLAK